MAKKTNGNGNGNGNGGKSKNEVVTRPVRHLTITLSQTENPDADLVLLHKLYDILRVRPGQDRVNLQIKIGEEVTPMAWPTVNVDFGPDLEKILSALVGNDALKLESPRIATGAVTAK